MNDDDRERNAESDRNEWTMDEMGGESSIDVTGTTSFSEKITTPETSTAPSPTFEAVTEKAPEEIFLSAVEIPAASAPINEPVAVASGPAHNGPGKNEKARSFTGFKRTAALWAVAAVLGGGSIGFGYSMGSSIASQYVSAKAEPAQQAFSFSNSASVPVQASQISMTTDVEGIVDKVSDAVVSINVSAPVTTFFNRMVEQSGAGSGIIFKEDGDKIYILTNNHVIDGADKVTISVDDQKQIPAKFIGSDPKSDIAVISVSKADMAGISYKLAEFGDSDALKVGQEVVAIGNAMGEGKTATRGIVSAKNKSLTIDGKTLNVIQTDAAINPGNSGGALANAQGQVIGVNTAKIQQTGVEGMGYSIPINDAKALAEELIKNGSVKHPYLGITGMSITDQMKEIYSLPSKGVYITEVMQGGAAQSAGLQASDIIVGYGQAKIETIEQLTDAIAASKVGDKVELYIYRNGIKPLVLNATIGDLNSNTNF